MIVLILVIASLIGIILTELTFRVFARLRLRAQLNKTAFWLKIFRRTSSDDVRQALLLRAGGTMLQLGLGMLMLFVLLAAIASLAPWLLAWNEAQLMVYFVALSIAATGWVMIKRARIRPPAHPTL